MSEWKRDLGIMDPAHIEHEMAGKSQKFYSVTGTVLGKVRETALTLGDCLIGVLNCSSKDDCSSMDMTQQSEGDFVSEKSVSAISPANVEMRMKIQKEAVHDFLSLAFSDAAQEAAALIVMDSLRDVFRRKDNGEPVDWPTEKEFLAATPIDNLTEGIIGAFKASRGVLGPLANNLEGLLTALQGKVEDLVVNLDKESLDEPETLSSESSKSPISGSPEEDSSEA